MVAEFEGRAESNSLVDRSFEIAAESQSSAKIEIDRL
jgi:hypothetical protein